MSARTLIKGIPIQLGGSTYVLPPASLATLEVMSAQLDKVNAAFSRGGNFSMRDLLFISDFAAACLRRNYPDIDRNLVAEHVGLDNMLEVMQMCLDASGLMRKQLETSTQGAASQEGGTLGESDGTASLPTS